LKQIGAVVLAAALAIIAGPGLAHESKGPNGGRIVDAGNYHAELVVNKNQVAVFMTDGDDKPVAPAGFKGVAIMRVGGKAERIALSPDGQKLSGSAPTALPANVIGVVRITTPDGKVAQGQYK
jgi:hypothetical protein